MRAAVIASLNARWSSRIILVTTSKEWPSLISDASRVRVVDDGVKLVGPEPRLVDPPIDVGADPPPH